MTAPAVRPAGDALVLGAGVAGVCTAWALARAGAAVTVLDRRPGPAQETSFANGGHVSAGQARPWATPAVPGQSLRWIGRADAPLRWPLSLDPPLWRWGLSFLNQCRPRRAFDNARTIVRLARYSRALLPTVVEQAGLSFAFRADGILGVYGDPRALARAARDSDRLDSGEQPLDATACVRLEPALADAVAAGRVCGGLLAPDGATGDAHGFTVALAEAASRAGVRFRTGIDIQGLVRGDAGDGARLAVAASDATYSADTVILALGQDSRAVAATIGVRLPVAPVKGVSVSIPATAALPAIGILDEDARVVLARLGDTFRAAGTAEFGNARPDPDPRRISSLLRAVARLFPAAARPEPAAAGAWGGIRSMTPDCAPLLGPVAGAPGLFLNTGHGSLGWTNACGAAQLVADLVAGRDPAIDPQGLTLARWT